jgi:hypothetical protein
MLQTDDEEVTRQQQAYAVSGVNDEADASQSKKRKAEGGVSPT